MARIRLAGSAVRIALSWIAVPIIFSLLYVIGFGQSWPGAARHILLSTITLSPLFLCVLLAQAAWWADGRLRYLGAVATALVVAIQVAFYALLLMGLASWGRVPTAALLVGYAHQVEPMLRALEVSPYVAVLGVTLFITGTSVFLAWSISDDWPKLAKGMRNQSGRGPDFRTCGIALLLALMALATAFRLWANWVLYPDDPNPDEPWYLVFEAAPVGRSAAQSLVFDHIGNQKRRQAEASIAASYQPSPLRRRKNLVLITVDALRPDHMSIYGYGRKTTPYLDSLAAAGHVTVMREARSACPESSCGLLSLLTGKQPHELLARNFGLMEILQRHGYRRTLVLSGDHTNFYRLREFYGQPDHYEDGASPPHRYANDDYEMLDRLHRLPDARADQPQFVFLHLMSVHGLGLRHPENQAWQPASSIYNLAGTLGSAGLMKAINFYDNGVLQADAVIRSALQILRQKHYLQSDTLVLVTADHAESLGEHGIRTHAQSLFDSVLRIPWLWIGTPPDLANAGVHAVQADFAPTVLTDLGIPVPPHMSGIPMQRKATSRITFHAQPPDAAVIRSGPEGKQKLIHNFMSSSSSWFDLRDDPAELAGKRNVDDETHFRVMLQELFRAGYGQFARERPAQR